MHHKKQTHITLEKRGDGDLRFHSHKEPASLKTAFKVAHTCPIASKSYIYYEKRIMKRI